MNADAPEVKKMRDAALAALENAYCPYSKFPVGAAVLTENGKIFAGCNVENVSYGLTICAERSAIFQAVAKGYHSVRAVVIVTGTDRPTPPCGACRQVIHEFNSRADVFVFAKDQDFAHFKLPQLLPEAYVSTN